eukprot:s6682_g3.t1
MSQKKTKQLQITQASERTITCAGSDQETTRESHLRDSPNHTRNFRTVALHTLSPYANREYVPGTLSGIKFCQDRTGAAVKNLGPRTCEMGQSEGRSEHRRCSRGLQSFRMDATDELAKSSAYLHQRL